VVNSDLLPRTDFLRLGTGVSFWSVLASAIRVDSLPGYTRQMFEILADFLASENRVALPGTKRVIGSLNLDGVAASVECFTQHDARVLSTRLAKSSFGDDRNRPVVGTRGQFFGYALQVDRHEEYEYAGIEYLKRQVEHIHGNVEYLIIVAVEANAAST